MFSRKYLNKFIIYFNNIIIFLKNLLGYTKYIRKVINKLYNTRLSLNINKYKINMTKTKYLGLVFTLKKLKILEKINIL